MSHDPRVAEAMRLHKISTRSHHVWQTLRALGEQDEKAQPAADDHRRLLDYLITEFARLTAELEEARKDAVSDDQILRIGKVDEHESGDDDPFGVDIAHVDDKQLISFARAILKAQGVVR